MQGSLDHIHFIGINGSGLSALAIVSLGRGLTVSGSDREVAGLALRVQAAGGVVYSGHNPENIHGATLVVRSSAVPDDNVEIISARLAGIPVLKRAEFLDRLTQGYRTLAVAGTHGKTTTTALLAWVLDQAGLDPTYVIGGLALNLNRNAYAGSGEYFVIEADEYDRMFLGLRPFAAIVTNIEHDHPDCFPTAEEFYQAFSDFAHQIQPDGMLVVCLDDPGVVHLVKEMTGKSRRILTYGFNRQANYRIIEYLSLPDGSSEFRTILPGRSADLTVRLQIPGVHNALNALAVLALIDGLGFEPDFALHALESFRGTGRRFEVRGQTAGVLVIDDYAHHPTEIRATLNAARLRYPGRTLRVVWQPHTYSRTRLLMNEFIVAFQKADALIVTEIYAAREPRPTDGFSSHQVVQEMVKRGNSKVMFAETLVQALDLLIQTVGDQDVVLVLSAGDADRLSGDLIDALNERINIANQVN